MEYTLSDGTRRKLRMPGELESIDPEREAVFVFADGGEYTGWCDGHVSPTGVFYIENESYYEAFDTWWMIGWCYLK